MDQLRALLPLVNRYRQFGSSGDPQFDGNNDTNSLDEVSNGIYASPIPCPPFTFYGDSLRVDGHERYSSRELYGLLTYVDPGPVLNKQGRPCRDQPPPHKDPTGAFYRAQLIHYGFEPISASQKQAVKKALLRVIEESVDGELEVPQDILELEEELRDRFRIANIAAKKKYEEDKKQKQRIRKEKNEREERARNEARLKRKRADDRLMAEFTEDILPPKKAKKSEPTRAFDFSTIEGTYSICAPDISEDYGYTDPFTFRLALSSTGGHIWGTFDFGLFEGKLRSKTPLATSDGSVTFRWRGRESGDGRTTFDSENIVRLKFLADGRFIGSIDWEDGKCKLMGKKDAERSREEAHRLNVKRWKSEYWKLDWWNFEKESVERWGKRYRGEPRKKGLNSDTEGEA